MYASNSVFTSCYVIPFSKGEMVMMVIHDYDHTQQWYVHDYELEHANICKAILTFQLSWYNNFLSKHFNFANCLKKVNPS